MDFFDLFPVVPPGGGSRGRSPEENLVTGVALVLLPIVSFVAVLFSGLAAHATLTLVVIPVALAGLVFLLARWLGVSLGRSLLGAFGCATACFIGNAAAMLLAALGSFYSTF